MIHQEEVERLERRMKEVKKLFFKRKKILETATDEELGIKPKSKASSRPQSKGSREEGEGEEEEDNEWDNPANVLKQPPKP